MRRGATTEFTRCGRRVVEMVSAVATHLVPYDQGIYARGWQKVETRTGGQAIVTVSRSNTAPHARVEEDGRRAGAKAPPVSAIEPWTIRRRIPVTPDTPSRRRSVAWLIARNIGRDGLPARRVVRRAIDEEAATIRQFVDDAGRQIARRYGG
jgi:hypothetical protein